MESRKPAGPYRTSRPWQLLSGGYCAIPVPIKDSIEFIVVNSKEGRVALPLNPVGQKPFIKYTDDGTSTKFSVTDGAGVVLVADELVTGLSVIVPEQSRLTV